MTTPGVPSWGCPWHGLVRDGELALPGGDVIEFPQPGGADYSRSVSRLVAHPDAPEDTRTIDQIEADEALGRIWRRTATIAGGTLYGVYLGSRHAWIYIDPAGDRWLCTLESALPAEPNPLTLTLKRFGVLGGAPESHTYLINNPDFKQSDPALGLVSLDGHLCDSSRDGSAALFVIGGTFQAAERPTFPFAPLGWYEIQLSGPGAACTVAMEVLRSREQALGTRIVESADAPGPYHAVGPMWDPVYGYEPNDLRSVILYGSISGDPVETLRRDAVLGRTLAMFYSPSGALRELTLDTECVVTGELTVDEVNFGPEDFSGEISGVTDKALSVRLSLDDVTIDNLAYSESITYSNVLTSTSGQAYTTGNDAWTRTTTVTRTYASGAVSTATESVSQNWGGYGVTIPRLLSSFNATDEFAARLGPYGAGLEWGPQAALGIFPAMHSLHVYALMRLITDESGTTVTLGTQCATPGGVRTVAAAAPSDINEFWYGAWCPVTGQLVRDSVPICWV